jgi:hypothetical protein
LSSLAYPAPPGADGGTTDSIDVLRHVPDDVASLLGQVGGNGRRQRVFLLLWWAGYEAGHAAALVAGPTQEVDALWRAAGAPGDDVLERMAADAAMVWQLVPPRPGN